jgi:hypothetical protein
VQIEYLAKKVAESSSGRFLVKLLKMECKSLQNAYPNGFFENPEKNVKYIPVE